MDSKTIEILGDTFDALEASFTILILLKLDAAVKFKFSFCFSRVSKLEE